MSVAYLPLNCLELRSPIVSTNILYMFNYPVQRNLKRDIGSAIAWGVPCKESLGYSAAEFTSLLNKAKIRIEQLESILNAYNIQFPQTDWSKNENTKTT